MDTLRCKSVFIILALNLTGISAKARPLPQSDDPLCRDDLCVQDNIRNVPDSTGDPGQTDDDVSKSTDPTQGPVTNPSPSAFQCPPTYRKVVRGEDEFCEPIPESAAASNKKRACPNGETIMQTKSGEICIPSSKGKVQPKCHPGHVPVQLEDKVLCVEPDPDYLHFCPPAHLRVFDDGQLKCYPIFNPTLHQTMHKKTPSLKGNRKGKKRRRKQRKNKPKRAKNNNKRPINKNHVSESKKASLTDAECEDGKVAALSADGYVCTEPVFPKGVCPENQVPALSKNGIECVNCPPGQGTVLTEGGIKCGPTPYPAAPSGTTVATHPSAATPQPADERCPEGLIPVQTAVGRICQYIPPTEPQEEPSCPPGQRAARRGGQVICEKTPKLCGPGQVVIETISGETVCGFSSGSEEKHTIRCPRGLVLVDNTCVYESEKPERPAMSKPNRCPAGQTLMKTGQGFRCFHDDQRVHYRCDIGSILTQTSTGFICRTLDLSVETVHSCGQGLVVVRVGTTFDCITVYEADLVCTGNELLMRSASGFECRRSEVGAVPGVCSDVEVAVVDEYGVVECISIDDANEKCGEGYRAVPLGSGFVCRKIKLDLNCPEGFILQSANSPPTCVSISDPECIDGFSSDCKGVLPGPHPCEDGYSTGTDEEGKGCFLRVSQPDLHQASASIEDQGFHTTYTTDQDPDAPPITGLDFETVPITDQDFKPPPILEPCGEEEGAIRPCDLDISILLAGCNPDCANGGTCIDGICSCPPGVSGSACHLDIDECRAPDRGSCEYKCENTFGSYHCSCPRGYTLNTDGSGCIAAACIPDCLNNGECRNGHCLCPGGFEGDYCQLDKNECDLYKDRLCQHHCRNTPGGYECVCPPGSRLNQDARTCTNTTCIPECRNGGSCEDSKCYCQPGFYGVICQFDLNECYTKQPCHHTCINTRGSYWCACNQGYVLDVDGHTCRPM